MSSSESNGHEPFELDPADVTPQKVETSPIEISLAPKVPYPRKKSQDDLPPGGIQRHFVGDTPFEDAYKAALKMVTVVAPSTPKIRQNVAQLNSQNLEAHRLKLAEMNKPATWAQAVQPKGPVSNAAVEQNLVVDATAKSVGILAETVNCDKVIGRSDLPESEEEEVENKVGTGNGPIWILPPADDETKKRKKKNKNKKKVANT